ncbi:3-isopropylmalate dehydratase large subunit [Candidatus Gottesmanbacteria bacterium RIFCSPLOWO2_01_FULL_39_12b]|uniref:3-isopropylmalate dehydratase large subunit n=1 Tax=Candidatus Gottesmanbacteria bacterium RIFCSPLOWO2_01_FULL_39_12b TaxID=1798388 RepID=A0A1F6ANV6_9BACT|nr:MAG: 3-isopropylmalate dehydratase large subunit [Candidatus Gottesmanbacteria bacterium RIFCSPLOWO2_01_FULL_39_12b]
MKPKTLFKKIWDNHLVVTGKNSPSIIYIDTHYIHEVTSPQAFENLRKKGLKVRRPDLTYATCDHNVSTTDQKTIRDLLSKKQVEQLVKNCQDYKIKFYGLDSPYQGIVHVIGPELGITQPGKTIVCGDSHTSTHGAFGCLAFGIGTTEVEQVLASQCLIQNPMKTMEIKIDGKLGLGVTAKDIILATLANIGKSGGTGHCIEYTGEVIRNIDMESRMTICNMSIEGGARAGMIAPDQTTFDYLSERKFVSKGRNFEKLTREWINLTSDKGAHFDKIVKIDGNKIEPLITWGTDPASGIRVNDKIPDPKKVATGSARQTMEKAIAYMNLKPGMKLEGFPITHVFIGSCTNARISDLRAAAKIVNGKKVKNNVTAWVVPGSRQVKLQAEKENLDKIFTSAGFEWRWSGCSACIAMNDDKIPSGKYCVSTSNRNYEGRQGPGSRTFIASPIMAAAAALEGKITDVRKYL